MQVSLPPILQSKKFVAAVLAATLIYLAMSRGMTMEQAMAITSPLQVFIVGQAVADVGKERVKAEATARRQAAA